MTRRRTLLLWLLLLVCLALPAQVLAHAALIRSEPTAGARLDRAPRTVRAWFTESLEPGFSALQVLDASGAAVDLGDSRVTPDDPASMIVSLPPELPEGSYTVSWKTLSAVDGHAIRGLFTFGVGDVAQSAPVGEAAAPEITSITLLEAIPRVAQYLAQTLLLGGFLLATFALQGQDASRFLRAFRTAALGAVVVLLLSAFGSLVLQASLASGQPLPAALGAIGSLLGTRFGTLWVVRLVLLLGLGALAWRGAMPSPRLGVTLLLGVLFGGALLLVNALYSHSAAVGQLTPLAVGADWLHQVAVSVWVGGLFALAVVLWRRPSQRAEPVSAVQDPNRPYWGSRDLIVDARGALLRFLPGFSRLALVSVPILALTGIYQSLLHVGSWGALLETAYGKAVLGKTVLFLFMALLGAFHLLVVQPRLGRDAGERMAARFRTTLLAEAALGVGALLLAGFLTSMQPAWQTYGQILADRPLVLETAAADLKLKLTVLPGRPGFNSYLLRVTDSAGQPAKNVQRAVLRFSFLDQDLGEVEVPLTPADDGVYQAQGGELGVTGAWQAIVIVRRQGLDDARTAVRFTLSPPSGAASQPVPLAGLPTPYLRSGLAILAALAGLVLGWYSWTRSGGDTRAALPGLAASLLVVCIGLYVGVRALSAAPSLSNADRRNPYPPDQASLATGQAPVRRQLRRLSR